jgi:hypothetical protein
MLRVDPKRLEALQASPLDDVVALAGGAKADDCSYTLHFVYLVDQFDTNYNEPTAFPASQQVLRVPHNFWRRCRRRRCMTWSPWPAAARLATVSALHFVYSGGSTLSQCHNEISFQSFYIYIMTIPFFSSSPCQERTLDY